MSAIALRRAAPWLAVVALVALLGSALMLEAHREVSDPGNSDSVAFATGARLVTTDSQHLYDPVAQERVEATLLSIPPAAKFLNPFTNIAAGAVILSPLSSLNLWTASAIAALVSTVLFAVALRLMFALLSPVASRPVRALIAVACVLSIPAVDALIQWDSLLTASLLGSLLLAGRQRCSWAGLLLATLLLKPQVVWLVVPALVAARSWRYLAGFLLGAAGWMGSSLIVAGPHGFVALAQLIAGQHVSETARTIGIPSLIASATGSGELGFVAAGCLGVLIGAVLLWRRDLLRGRPVAAVAIGVPLSLLCSPHVTPQDLMLLAGSIAFVARTWPVAALFEALSISGATLLQFVLPLAGRHLEPLVLVVVAASALLAARPSTTAVSARAKLPIRVQTAV